MLSIALSRVKHMNITGIGVDTEAIERFRAKAYEEHEDFYGSIFSKDEIAYCLGKADPAASFAGKFCAKESVAKAFKKNNVFAIASIKIINNEYGEPKAYADGNALQCMLSVSHSSDYAVAFCIAYA